MNCHSVRGGSSFIVDLSSVYRMKELCLLAFHSSTAPSSGMSLWPTALLFLSTFELIHKQVCTQSPFITASYRQLHDVFFTRKL
jgi:hypothetical protein